jgi:hypothetical protein
MPITKYKTALDKIICKNLNAYEYVSKIDYKDIKNLLLRFNACLTLRFTHSQAGNGSLTTFKDLTFNKIFIQAQ